MPGPAVKGAAQRLLRDAILKQLAMKELRKREAASRRAALHQEVLAGRRGPAFDSPPVLAKADPHNQRSDGWTRAVAVVLLPRWESLEAFATEKVDVRSLRFAGDDERPLLCCLICRNFAGSGEIIVALACSHIFCSSCFEARLHKLWAAPPRETSESERDMVPCPVCEAPLAKRCVHTLQGYEIQKLWSRVRPQRAQRPSLGSEGKGTASVQVTLRTASEMEQNLLPLDGMYSGLSSSSRSTESAPLAEVHGQQRPSRGAAEPERAIMARLSGGQPLAHRQVMQHGSLSTLLVSPKPSSREVLLQSQGTENLPMGQCNRGADRAHIGCPPRRQPDGRLVATLAAQVQPATSAVVLRAAPAGIWSSSRMPLASHRPPAGIPRPREDHHPGQARQVQDSPRALLVAPAVTVTHQLHARPLLR